MLCGLWVISTSTLSLVFNPRDLTIESETAISPEFPVETISTIEMILFFPFFITTLCPGCKLISLDFFS